MLNSLCIRNEFDMLKTDIRFALNPAKKPYWFGRPFCILVLGMHGSGNAALAGSLFHCGVFLGKKLLPATAINKKGFFENLSLFYLHKQIMRRRGYDWNKVSSYDWENLAKDRKVVDKVKQYVVHEFARKPVFAIKDPRLCMLLPIYHQVFEELDIDYHVVWLKRDREAICDSLKRRFGIIDTETTEHLTTEYYYFASRHIEGVKCETSFMQYEDLLARPILEIQALELAAGIRLITYPNGQMNHTKVLKVENFIDPKLNHYRG
jgi:hypothetical protein